MGEVSRWTRIAQELGEELHHRRQASKASKVIPFGEERVAPSVLRQRLIESEAMRRQMLTEPGGREKLLRLFKEG